VRKVERLREIAGDIEEKLKPLLNSEQEDSFRRCASSCADAYRKMASKAADDVDADIKAWFSGKASNMPEQRERRGSGDNAPVFRALFLCASSVATACPLCLGAFQLS